MSDKSRPIDEHELGWMFLDAYGLFHFGRKSSAMLLLLCAVDAFAKRADPQNPSNGDRYRNFLKEKLPPHTRVENFNIKVPNEDDLLRLEFILYKFLRNPMIHEGSSLQLEEYGNLPVVIDWSFKAPSVKPTNERLTLGGEWLANVLFGVVQTAITNDLIPPDDSSDDA